MAAAYRRSAFLFRRDLRLDDNRGLQKALDLSNEVIACFVLDPDETERPDRNLKALQFELESLDELERTIAARGGRLYRFRGELTEVVEHLVTECDVEAVFVNRDYSPSGREADAALQSTCTRLGAFFGKEHDALLFAPGTIVDELGRAVDTFPQFAAQGRLTPVAEPHTLLVGGGFFAGELPVEEDRSIDLSSLESLGRRDRELYVRGGRRNALAVLEHLAEFDEYEKERERPALDATTGLSAHLRTGTCSPREVWYAIRKRLGPDHPLLDSLLRRDFYVHLAWSHPWLVGSGGASDDGGERFLAWCEGRTGVPIVDAGMRQLAGCGFMNDRIRQITAGFLVARLRVDWRHGARFFAEHLVDADPCLNDGNWRSVLANPRAGVEAWSEQRRIDPDARFIKEWIPELDGYDAATIHNLLDERPDDLDYPFPLAAPARRDAEEEHRPGL